ncbi:hypothetical protein TNCV_2204191 [Trichonephila clavipes]|nr:hypothetical protein TNCV_2204191 [Trichonephila clavipes]
MSFNPVNIVIASELKQFEFNGIEVIEFICKIMNPLVQQMKSSSSTGSVELSGKFTTRLATVLFNDRLQGFVFQGLWSSCLCFITERQISRPEFLKPMSCRTFIDHYPQKPDIFGDLMQRLISPF